MEPVFRNYDPELDAADVRRIWQEVGWLDYSDNREPFLVSDNTLVAEVGGAAECLVSMAPGAMRYQDSNLAITCVTAVTTSRTVRKRGFASQLAARALADAAAAGSSLAVLGMFEQGYYNRLGFGTGTDSVRYAFDPAHLLVSSGHGHPSRLSSEDWEELHQARLRRLVVHGGCNIYSSGITRFDTYSTDGKQFGLGYRDEAGELTHFIWFNASSVESGPYYGFLVFRNWDQFRELMSLIRSLGDQVHLVDLAAPPLIQMQDLLRQPFKHRRVTDRGAFRGQARTAAWWQARILNLSACIQHASLSGERYRLNLVLDDPIQDMLPAESAWRGLTGEYVLTLGQECRIQPGNDAGLDTLRAGIGAFTRLWLGVLSATALSVTDNLSAPAHVLERLDKLFQCLPRPHPDWEF